MQLFTTILSRGLFLCLLVLSLSLSRSWAEPLGAFSPETKEELAYTTGVQAFIYSYPLLHVNQFRYMFGSPDSPRFSGPANQLNHSRKLASSQEATAASPNNDTLYTLAFIDLSEQPVRMDTPEMGDRYYTVQLSDFYASNFGDIGTRHNGGARGKYLIVGPEWQGNIPSDITQVYRSPTPWAIVLLRILVDNQKEFEAVHMLQDKFKLKTLDGKSLPPFDSARLPSVPEASNPAQVWSVINRELTTNPPPASDRPLVDQFAAVGIGPGQPQDISLLDPAVQRGLTRAAKTGMQIVSAAADRIGGGKTLNGWSYAKADVGRYGTDYLYRAGVTRMGLVANDPIEATYLSLYVDADGKPLNGSGDYKLHFTADNLPPAKAFWSVTLYDRKTYSLVDNVIDRFSIGDRTDGIEYEEDGSLNIYIGQTMPVPERKANWLPAPEGDFYLLMRIYLPEVAVAEQTWEPPALELLP
jgi:hypothetical protein